MNTKSYVIAFCVLLITTTASAEVSTEDFPFCNTYSGLKEIWRAASERDSQQYKALLKNEECMILKSGIQLSIIKKIGVIYKVRLYIDDESFVMYTNDDGFKR